MADAEAARAERLRALGFDYQSELSRVTSVKQPVKQPPPPEWLAEADAARRYELWLEEGGARCDAVNVVPAGDAERFALVTSGAVAEGGTLFEVPASMLLTADVALRDRTIGRDLARIEQQQRQRGGASAADRTGFETFALAAMLAAERVQRGAVRGRLRRQDGGVLGGGKVLPQWEVKDELGEKAGGRPWSPLVASLQWPAEEACLIEEGRAEAVTAGAALIAQLVEPVARSAWMRTTQRSGVAQATSEEDCGCTAVQALLLAMEALFVPPPPLDSASGERRWGGGGGGGVALCPLANLAVLPREDAAAAAAAGAVNARLGRPPDSSGSDGALRCVATRDLPAGALVIAADYREEAEEAEARAGEERPPAAGDRVTVVSGALSGRAGVVARVREEEDAAAVVRFDGSDKLVVMAPSKLRVQGQGARPRRSQLM